MSKKVFFYILLLYSIINPVFAGQPFITSDPNPAPYKKFQIYPFIAYEHSSHGWTAVLPGFELDYGIAPGLEITFATAYLQSKVDDETRANGFSDTEIGFQYQFLKETKCLPAVAFEAHAFLPTGNAHRDLGNGKIFYRMPLSIEKNFEKWDLYASIGFSTNTAKFEKNYWFGGVVALYKFTEKFSFGSEIYYQGQSGRQFDLRTNSGTISQPAFETTTIGAEDSGYFYLLNLGGEYEFNENVTLQFAGGRSIRGVQQIYGYFGLEIET